MIDRLFWSIKWRLETFFAAEKHIMIDLRPMAWMGIIYRQPAKTETRTNIPNHIIKLTIHTYCFSYPANGR